MAEEDSLKVFWDHFFKAETGTYEKSTWLDLFLAEFMIRTNNGANPKDLIKFCPVSGVVSLVGCELLCGIHRVTSSVNVQCLPMPPLDAACSGKEPVESETAGVEPKTEEPRSSTSSSLNRSPQQTASDILRNYLLKGIAWRCLVLLKTLGVEGLSCCRQLSSVLVWVVGELRGAPHVPRAPPRSAPATAPIHTLFSHRIWSKQKLSGSPGSKSNSTASSDKGSSASRSRSNQSSQDAESKTKRKFTKQNEQSSDSGESNGDLQVLNRSMAIKICKSNDDFEYFDAPTKSPREYRNETLYRDPFYTPRKIKPKADDYMTDKHKEIINSEISTFDFTLLIIDLLQELCKTESSLSGSEGSQVSVQCINFSLRNLCSLQFGSLPLATQYNSEEVSRIKVALTELLIVSLDKVLIHSDLCAKLINNGILPMLLRILEDVICKSSSKFNAKDEHKSSNVAEKLDKTESDNLLKFVFGVAYSITAFFHCLLMQCRSVDKLRAFTDQFKLYAECLKGDLFKECIEFMIRIPADEEDRVTLIKKLIESIGKLIFGMKRIRSEVVHSAACPRSRHKICRQRVAAGMHHHHDILGEAGTGLPLASSCCVSVLYGTLTSLATDEEVSAQSLLRSKILRTMLHCGVCCCFSPGFLMESIVRLMLTHNSVATMCLQLLEHTVYGELGASVLVPKITDQLPCSICEPCEDRRDLIRKYCPHGVSSVERKSVWSFLIHYNSLLQLDNHNNVLHATVSHLLRVTPKCRMEMKYELLFSVVYPTFIVAKHRYIIRMEEAAYFLTVSCLNIFASLLNTVSFAEQFIQKGGLSYVLELVSLSEFSNQCCAILEIAIVVEIFKLMKENSGIVYDRDMSSLASVQMLFKSLSEMTEKCYKIYKLKLPTEKFEELCDVSKEKESLLLQHKVRAEVSPRRMSTPRPIKTSYASGENVVEDSMEDHLEVLKNVWTFWKSCAGLCLYSPMFRRHMISESVFVDSYALLKVLLYYLCNCECGMPEMRILIKIVEALLTMQFAVTDVTSGRSKHTSCNVVRKSVSVGATLEIGGGLRALCEALIRVCLTRPSAHHAMPAQTQAKVPPLGCESGASSPAGSSSEDSSASGPYASENSEPTRPDPGYEADIEIGQLELLRLQKSRKLSGLSALHSITGYSNTNIDTMEMECAEYTKDSQLAHPELCIIVVDVLTQLIHKLVSAPPERQQASTQRATGSLARACCSRLAGALAGAGAAPPALLAKLLAPPAAALLAAPHTALQDLQRSILELIHVVASQSITPLELAAFLRLFTADTPPLGPLLSALLRLVSSTTPATPDCILSFPIDPDETDQKPLAEELNFVVLNGATSQSLQAEAVVKKLRDAHRRTGIISPWSVCAVYSGVEGVGWSTWLHGFAVLVWVRPDAHATHTPRPRHARSHARKPHDDTPDDWQSDSQEMESKPPNVKKEAPTAPSELHHVVSLGTDTLILELWIETVNGSLTLRLSRPEASSSKIVSETRVGDALPVHKWSCLAFNVSERVIKRKIHIQVTLFVNGHELETVSLPLQGILVRKVCPSCLLLGHTGRSASYNGAYHMSLVHVYRHPLLTNYTALHLTAHGPDQVQCEGLNYPQVLTPEVLECDLDWDQVYDMSSTTLRELHENLLMSFAAHAPNIVNLYHQNALSPSMFSGRVSSTGGLLGSGGVSNGGGSSVPEALAARWLGNGAALPSYHRGLAPALYLLGGPDLLLYLFARVVELDGSPEEQSVALSILLRACRADNRLYGAFYDGSRLAMLDTVLASPKCIVSVHIIKVILDEACSSPVLVMSGSGVLVLGRADAVLLEPRLLLLLMRAWRQLATAQEMQWEVEGSGGVRSAQRGSPWALWLQSLQTLVRDHHPHRALNHYQMERVQLLPKLLDACKERLLNSECGPLEPAASSSVVGLARGLCGEPPQIQRLVMLCDFLLLMHQASDTFVTHSRANFYFLLTPETQETSQFQSSKRRQSKRTRKKQDEVTDRSSSSVNSDEVIDDCHGARREKTGSRMESSAESTKQMKGLINMQIKEGRKHVSSTSENSDPNNERTAEESGVEQDLKEKEGAPPLSERGGEGEVEGEGDKEQTLKDFVVVDVDDVTKENPQMYSSGIYQQRAVRAGAEPGWSACEGLLLLLRDMIAVLPDHALTQTAIGSTQAESLLVLSNQPCGRVRAAAVRALSALDSRTRRAHRTHRDADKKLRPDLYYVHLANQITLYPVTWELATACAALLTKCDVPLEDQLDDDIWLDMTEEAVVRSPPLLALLPACVEDVPLAHNITLIIRRIIEKASLKMLSEVCVAEVVVRSVRAVGRLDETTPNFEGRDLLLNDLYELLNSIAVKAVLGQHTMQNVVELHHLLTYVELEGSESTARVCRAAQLSLFHAELDCLEDRLHSSYSPNTKYTNYFTTVLSSAVSLGADSAMRGERGELCAGLGAVLRRAAAFVVALPPHQPAEGIDKLLDRLFATLLPGASGEGSRARWWSGGAGGAGGAEWTALLQEVWWWAAAPSRAACAVHPLLLRRLYRAPHHAAALTPHDPSTGRKLAVYLLSMLKHIHADAESGAPSVELAITDWARGWALGTQAGLPDRVPSDTLLQEADRLLAADVDRWAKIAAKQRPIVAKTVFSKEVLASRVTEGAMSITRAVVDLQNAERKAFMQSLRRLHADRGANAQRWQRLISAHTHEQGVWHEPGSYPRAWQLDPTEGPARVRLRLRRTHLDIHPRFLKHTHRHKLDSVRRGSPLQSVVCGGGSGSGVVATTARLQLTECVCHMARVTYVTVAHDAPGELLLTDRCIHFVPEDVNEQGDSKESEKLACQAQTESWPLEGLVSVSTRRWCLQERAVEIFLSSGHAHLIAFNDVNERSAFLKALSNCHLPGKLEPDTLTEAMNQWRNGQITNWEYLMRLNALAGRTYNDLMQYPVLPFILADYTSKILDLNDPKSFRDLSKPMAIQNKNREQHYIKTYNDLVTARSSGCSPLVAQRPYHYASLYSNSGGVLHYLVRLPPFTQLFLNYQDNNFDMPDRTFHSLATTWRLITNDSPTDVKELIPELFYLPELFHNNEGLELGVRQCGLGIDDVELPPWAGGDSRLFTLVHRHALEAPLVSERLPHWIDLVFGYKQTGQAAIDAINVFPACTYYGFDPLSLEHELDRTAAAAMVRTYGQAPRQLLRAPHPHRASDLLQQPAPADQCFAWSGVVGARWGRYCGSPGGGGAVTVLCRRAAPHAPAALQPLTAPRTAAAPPPNSALIVLPTPGEHHTGPQSGSTSELALVSWGHSDNIVRLKRKRDARHELILHVPALDQITKVATCCMSSGSPTPLFVGLASGRVISIRAGRMTSLRTRTRTLHAHRAPVADVHVCGRAGLLATVSTDGLIVLWDLNTLSYIRTLPNRDMLPVSLVTISPTLCDVATVHSPPTHKQTDKQDNSLDVNKQEDNKNVDDEDSYEKDSTYKYQSLLRVHTVNARFVGSVKVVESVSSVCYSCGVEGVTVNCVAAGLRTGGVVLYSAWDLTTLAHVQPAHRSPLLSLCYSSDSSILFGWYAEGGIVAWSSAPEQGSGSGKQPPVKILPAHALF